jgi:transcriptional regulator with XRE-family HTH domain
MNREIVAQRLRESRKEIGLTIGQMSEKLGISPAALTAYELGKKLPSLETFVIMAEIYDESYEYLLGKKSVRLGEQTNLGKNIAELLLSGKVQCIETDDENLSKKVKNISAICNSAQLSRESKIEIIEAYIQNSRE